MSQTLSKCDFQKPSVTDAMACHVKHPKSRGPPSWGSTDLSNLCLRYLSNVWIMNQIFLTAHHCPDFEACLCRGSCWAARSRRSFSWVASSSPRVSMSLELKWEMSQFDGRDNIAGTDIVCFMVELIQLLSRLLKKDNNANSWLTTNILNKLNGSLATTETCFSYHQKQKLKEDLGLARATLVSIINTSSLVVRVVLLWSVSNVSVEFLLVVLLVI